MHSLWFERAFPPGSRAEKVRVDTSGGEIEVTVAGELCQLKYLQRLAEHARNVLASGKGGSTGRALFEGAHRGGAPALGVAVTGIPFGAPADIVSLATGHPAPTTRSRERAH